MHLLCLLLQLQAAFSSRDAARVGCFRALPAAAPTREFMLVFVGNSEDSMRAGAAAAATAGFQRTAILQGGLPAFARSTTNQVPRPRPPPHEKWHIIW